jgi:hypothetical protein
MPIIFHCRFTPLIILIGIFCVYILSVVRMHPTNFFGMGEDDAIYFSSAQALAQGRGYILPSVPGTPPATKYPILYPLILAAVWRFSPSFPGNLVPAIAVTVAFGIWFLTAVFIFLRNLKAFSDIECLLLTTFCALHPLVLFYSGSLLSDIPFAALTLAAVVLADKSMKPEGKTVYIAVSGILAGLSVLMRLFGLPVIAGIVVAAVVKRAWRGLLIFSACILPFALPVLWRIIFPLTASMPVKGTAAAAPNWVQTWFYYTSYWAMWKISVPNAHFFWAMLQNNALMSASGPADFLLAPMFVHDTLFGRAIVLIVGFVTLAGMVGYVRARGWSAIHFSLPFYLLVILCWNYADGNNRYLLPYWPLFAASLWFELRRLLGQLKAQLLAVPSWFEKVALTVVGSLVVVLICAVVVNCAWGLRRTLAEKSQKRAALLVMKRGAYDWIARNAPPSARVIAYDDPNVYLYTGRMSIRPIFFSTAELFEPQRLNEAITHMIDVPCIIGAEYWLSSADDFQNEWPSAAVGARQFMSGLARSFPVVYRSPDDQVLVYSLARVQEGSGCQRTTFRVR